MLGNDQDAWRCWKVAVTGMNAKPDNPGPGYAVARCLKESTSFKGRVIGCGYDVLDPGLYAGRVTDAGYLLPYPSSGEEALMERILEIHEIEGLDVIIPCLDAELPSFMKLEPRLKMRGIRLLIPESRSAKERDKDRLPELCAATGVVHPRTQKVTDPGFFDRCLNEGWDYPLVVKGPFYDARVAVDAAHARSAFHWLAQEWGFPVLVQEYVCGQELNLTGIGDGRGKLLGTVMMAKRALTDKGKAWAGITIQDQELEGLANRLVAALEWKGPLEVEALRSADGTLYLIEINPRFPAWVYLTHGVHRNLPVQLLRLLAGETTFVFPALPTGRMFIRYAEELIVDLTTFEHMLMRGERPAKSSHVA